MALPPGMRIVKMPNTGRLLEIHADSAVQLSLSDNEEERKRVTTVLKNIVEATFVPESLRLRLSIFVLMGLPDEDADDIRKYITIAERGFNFFAAHPELRRDTEETRELMIEIPEEIALQKRRVGMLQPDSTDNASSSEAEAMQHLFDLPQQTAAMHTAVSATDETSKSSRHLHEVSQQTAAMHTPVSATGMALTPVRQSTYNQPSHRRRRAKSWPITPVDCQGIV